MKLKIMLLAMTVLASGGAQAQVVVSEGMGASRDCYVHARFGFDPLVGIKTCTIALTQPLTAYDRAATYDNRGVILNRQGRIDQAASDFNRAIALHPKLGDAYVNSGAVLIRKQSYEDALSQINKGLAFGVSFPEIGYYNRALALEALGRFREAYYDYKKALELEPTFAPASQRLTNFVVTPSPASPPG
jgi:tetratricopeptide (TPR) repeat protein